MIGLLSNTLTLDITLIGAILGICVILTSAVIAIFKLYSKLTASITETKTEHVIALNNINNSLLGQTKVLANIVMELEAYGKSIEKNEKAIAENTTNIKLINQRCEFSHLEKE